MKTIEERAEQYAWSVWPNPMFAQEWEECKENYIAGATEQKAIDDAECVNKVLMGKGSSINYYKQGYHDAIDRVCEWLRARNVITKDTLIGFRKAMEE